MTLDRKATLLSMAASMVDQIVRLYGPALDAAAGLELEERVDLYRGAYFRIEEEALAQLNLVLIQDGDQLLSLQDDIDQMLQRKLQEFALRYNPIRDNLN